MTGWLARNERKSLGSSLFAVGKGGWLDGHTMLRSLKISTTGGMPGTPAPPQLSTSEVGRFLRKRHVRRDRTAAEIGPPNRTGIRSSPWHAISTGSTTGTDRSEIGPYHGSHWATHLGLSINLASTEHLRGRAISPKAPRPQRSDRRTRRRYGTFRGRQSRRAVPRGRTARRSVPTCEHDTETTNR